MTEKSVSRADNNVMGRVYDSASTYFLCGKAGMQISWIEVTMYYVRPFPFYEGSQVQERVLVKKILVVGPWMYHLNTLYPNIEPGKLLCQWTWTRTNNFDVYSQFSKSLHEIQHMAFCSPNGRITNNLHY